MAETGDGTSSGKEAGADKTPAGKTSWIARVAGTLETGRKAIAGVVFLVLLAGFLVVVARGLGSAPALTLAPISVPPELAARGVSSEVARDRLRDALAAAYREAGTSNAGLVMPRLAPAPEISEPTIGLSADAAVAAIRRALGIEGAYVAGNAVCADSACSDEGVTLRLRMSDGVEESVAETAPQGGRTVDALFDEAALAVLRFLKPHVAAQILVQAQETREEARDIARRMMRDRHEDAPWAALLLGNAEMLDGQPEDALKWYARAEEEARAAGLPDFSHPVQNRGLALQTLGDHAAAEEAYRKVTREDPADFNAWWGLGNVLQDSGRHEDALGAYETAAALAPGESGIAVNWALSLYELGRFEAAVDKLDLLTDLDPANADAWNNKGNALARLGRDEAAETSYRRAAELAPADPAAWFNLGDLRYEQGRLDEAEPLLVKARDLAPDLPGPATRLADLQGDRGDYALAVALYRDVAAQHPEFPHVWSNWEATLDAMVKAESGETDICAIVTDEAGPYLEFAGDRASPEARDYFGRFLEACADVPQ